MFTIQITFEEDLVEIFTNCRDIRQYENILRFVKEGQEFCIVEIELRQVDKIEILYTKD